MIAFRRRSWPLPLRVTLFVAALSGLLLPLPASSQRVFDLDRIIAVVNDDVIMQSELLVRMNLIRNGLEEAGTSVPPEDVLSRQVLERLIVDRIQLQLAEEYDLRIEDDEFNRAMDDLAARNNLSISEFREIMERDGHDFAKLREEIRDELLVSRVQQRFVNNRVAVSSRDIDDYLATVEKQGGGNREFRLGHILVSVPEGASPEEIGESLEKTRSLLEELRAGLDFSEAAVAHSDGQQALQGGDLGWRRVSELPTLFADVVPALSRGEISEPIRSPSGFHIVKVLDIGAGQTHVLTQTRARHILLQPNEVLSEAEARSRLLQLRERIVNGAGLRRSRARPLRRPGQRRNGR